MSVTKQQSEKGLPSKTINIIRTTLRNNIELTAIADNKANVLLSLNALMLTAIVPYALANAELILQNYLYIPILCATITCFVTIYQAAMVLIPSNFDKKRASMHPDIKPSPFFFGNFYKMEADEYYEQLQEGLSASGLIKAHLAQDLFYVGQRLGTKMARIRRAFYFFLLGIFITLIAAAVILMFFQQQSGLSILEL